MSFCVSSGSVVKMEQNRYPHESALASLVDVAAAQPSLPVPKDEHKGRVGLPKGEFQLLALHW